jgi:hypothetical protein
MVSDNCVINVCHLFRTHFIIGAVRSALLCSTSRLFCFERTLCMDESFFLFFFLYYSVSLFPTVSKLKWLPSSFENFGLHGPYMCLLVLVSSLCCLTLYFPFRGALHFDIGLMPRNYKLWCLI